MDWSVHLTYGKVYEVRGQKLVADQIYVLHKLIPIYAKKI